MQNILRLIKILWVLARNDALFLLSDINMAPPALGLFRMLAKKDKTTPKGVRLANAFVSLGPTFIKLGQMLSTRADLVGEDVAEQLAFLRDKLSPFPFEQAKEIIENELHDKLENLFLSFDESPIAAASIAQVHFAKTNDNQEVAVKILRPNIEKEFSRDLNLFKWLAEIVERSFKTYRRLQPMEVVATLESWIKFETDLRFEAAAASELAENTKNDDGFRVPKIFWALTAQKVMTMERITGTPIADKDAINKAGFDSIDIANKVAVSFYRQVFRDGFFHGDMHPGNLFVDEKGNIVVVDFGIMGRLDMKNRAFLAQVFDGFLREDYMKVAKIHFDEGIVPRKYSVDSFAIACRSIAKPIVGKPLNEISIAKLLAHLFSVSETFEMVLQPQFLLLQKNMMMAEGIGRIHNPNANMWEVVKPLVENWANKNLKSFKAIRKRLRENMYLLAKIPEIIANTDELTKRILSNGAINKPYKTSILSKNSELIIIIILSAILILTLNLSH